MTVKSFHLAGEEATPAAEIDVSSIEQLSDLQTNLAEQFSIVNAGGIGFQSNGHELIELDDVKSAPGSIAITIDGHSIREVPGPQGQPFFGNYLELYPDHLGNNERWFKKYGSLFKTSSMGTTQIQCNNPELALIAFTESPYFSKLISTATYHPLHPIHISAAGVFVGDTDEPSWGLVHRFLAPAFGPKAVRHYAPTMNRSLDGALHVFDELERRDEAWNVYQYMLKLASTTTGKLVLGMDLKQFDDADSPSHPMVVGMAELLALNKKIVSRGHWYAALPFGDPERLRKIEKYMVGQVEETVARAESAGNEDLPLQEAALRSANVIDCMQRATDSKGEKLPKENLVLAVLAAFTAGFITTSSLLSWLLHSLVKHPDAQEKLLQELIDNDFQDDMDVTPELIERLPYLTNFVKETQRVHNPSYQPGRTARKDCILPGGYRIHQDDVIIPAIHHIHNNPAYWDNPDRFDVGRWDRDDLIKHKAQYVPFATGQRMCIGFNFALQEVKIFVPRLVWRYQWFKQGESAVEYDPFFQLIRPVNLYVRTERRTVYPSKSTSLQA